MPRGSFGFSILVPSYIYVELCNFWTLPRTLVLNFKNIVKVNSTIILKLFLVFMFDPFLVEPVKIRLFVYIKSLIQENVQFLESHTLDQNFHYAAIFS